MKKNILFVLMMTFAGGMMGQTYEDGFTRSLSDVMRDVEKKFDIRLKYDMDTTGLKVKFADFRIRPYSEE